MDYSDLYFLVRVFDDVLEDYNEYRYYDEASAIDWFRYWYDLGKVVSLRKVQIASSFSNESGDFKPKWIKLDPPAYASNKGDLK